MAGLPAPVSAELLVWARESSGLTVEEAARRIGVSVDRLLSAEAGTAPLTLNQARKAAAVFDRPFALMFLPHPPQEEPLEVQFRRFRDAPSLPWPPRMRALAREVPALQDEAHAVFEALEEEPRWGELADVFGRAPDMTQLAARVRAVVGISVDAQKAAARADPQGFKVFRLWREAIEELGILVLQDGSLPLRDMRGFAVPHARVPALVINTNDDVRARLFTMLHELAHLFWSTPEEQVYEESAGATLLPAHTVLRDFRAVDAAGLLERVDSIARLYGTTPDATAVRLGWLEVAPWSEIHAVRGAIAARGGRGSRASGGNFYRNVVARFGPRFVGRVLEGVGQSTISELAAARLLGVRIERFDQLRRELGSDAA